MPESAFSDQYHRQFSSSYGGGSGGVVSDSEMYSMESGFTLFSSSASASVERCSSVSDHESLVSDKSLIQHLSGDFRGSSTASGSDPDPNKNFTVHKNGGPHLLGKKVEKAKAIKEFDVEIDGGNETLCSARSSFSYTNKECQNRKSRSEILLRRSDRRRPASLDLNNQTISVTSSSPRLGVAMKSSVSAQRSCMPPSLGMPNHQLTSFGVQKGWSSERVPLHRNANRIQGSFTLMPNGRTLPSKWEDAERWIISPVAGDDTLKPSAQQLQRRPKAKSGPLGPPGSACHSMCSPVVPSFGGNAKSFATESPLKNGVSSDNNLMIQYQEWLESNENYPSMTDLCIARSVTVHGCPEFLSQSSSRITQDDKVNGSPDAATNDSCGVLRRDVATQMSPEDSPDSSPMRTTSSPLSLSTLVLRDMQQVHMSKADIKDVQVDDQVTSTQCSKKSRSQISGRGLDIMDEWKNEKLEVSSADLEASEMIKSLSKVKREEAKITAWENLQRAKAEAAIQKLEMKLEKKRSSSMDRIMHKLRSAQKKAQEMRESVLSNQSHQLSRSSHKANSLIKNRRSGCFTCPAF